MFDALSDRLERISTRLRGKGRISEADLDEALQEIRTALLEADVELTVARRFCDGIRLRVSTEALSKSLTPGQQVIRAVHEELVSVLGGDTLKLSYASRPPTVVLMAGLQGSGKTTNSAKLALWWKQQGRNPILVGADLQRPAAVEQLRVLGEQAGVTVFSEATDPVAVCQGRPRGGPPPGQGHLHHRHRRPPDHRRRADAADQGHLGGDPAPLHVPRHRRHDRPGRRGHGQGVPRHPRAERRDPDQARRRRPRRRGAVRQGGGRQADRLRQHGRAAGGLRPLPPRSHGRPHPRHGGRAEPHRAGRAHHGHRRGGQERQPPHAGPVHPRGLPLPAPPGQEDGIARRADAPHAGHVQGDAPGRRPDRRRRGRQGRGHRLLHDPGRAQRRRPPRRLAPQPGGHGARAPPSRTSTPS